MRRSVSRLFNRHWMLGPLLAGILVVGGAADAGTKEDIQALKQELAKVKAELKKVKGDVGKINAALRSITRRNKPPAATATVATKGHPAQGRKDAPLTLVEFSDFECPFCKRFFYTTLVELKQKYVDTGKLRLVFRDFPLTNVHLKAAKAAEAAHCAGDQGKYWPVHDKLFENSRNLGLSAIKGHAKSLGLDEGKFSKCLSKGVHAQLVKTNTRDGVRAGVRGTPTFFIGPTGSGPTITGTRVAGAQPFSAFKRVIEAELAKLAKKGK